MKHNLCLFIARYIEAGRTISDDVLVNFENSTNWINHSGRLEDFLFFIMDKRLKLKTKIDDQSGVKSKYR